MSDLVRRRVDGPIERWCIDRPAARNALSRETVQALTDCVEAASRRTATRAVVLTGSGTRAFCAGADLKERRGMTAGQTEAYLDDLRACLDALDSLAKPTLAAINGVALGGGLELALACDFRIAMEHAYLGLPEVTLGIIPGAGGTQRLTRLLGEARAKQAILFGERLDANRALGLGLVHAVVPSHQSVKGLAARAALDQCADAWMEPLATGAGMAIAAALHAIDGAWARTLDEGLAVEREAYRGLVGSQDRAEALAAFAEKRPPRFRGC